MKMMPLHLDDDLTSRIRLRIATDADLPALEWNGEYSHFRQLYRDIYLSARKGEALLWVAELIGDGIIGQLFVQLTSTRNELADGVHRAYIYGFRIKTEFRRLGIGSYMLQFIEADLGQRGFQRICLNVDRENIDARRLYERFGYIIVAAEAGYWSYLDENGIRHFVHEPAWRMEKDLIEISRLIER